MTITPVQFTATSCWGGAGPVSLPQLSSGDIISPLSSVSLKAVQHLNYFSLSRKREREITDVIRQIESAGVHCEEYNVPFNTSTSGPQSCPLPLSSQDHNIKINPFQSVPVHFFTASSSNKKLVCCYLKEALDTPTQAGSHLFYTLWFYDFRGCFRLF